MWLVLGALAETSEEKLANQAHTSRQPVPQKKGLNTWVATGINQKKIEGLQ